MEKADTKKVILGQFFTKESIWLKKQVKDFILCSGCTVAYDPFAGAGDLLEAARLLGFDKTVGLDIDPRLPWQINDSLKQIPSLPNAIIITNPPYIASYSAARKKVFSDLQVYFHNTYYDNIYLLALEQMLKAQQYVVAIVPETFINTSFYGKTRLHSLTVLEQSPFYDTDYPVVVACFDAKEKNASQVSVYKNEQFVNTLEKINSFRLKPTKDIKIQFNDKNGWLALRAIDLSSPQKTIAFDFKDKFNYDWTKGIKVSSRLYSLIDIAVEISQRENFINQANAILSQMRYNSADIIFSPFKGNTKAGARRRRLDYTTARAILELSYKKIYGEPYEQYRFF